MSESRRVAIIGGGLAGLAAAVAFVRDTPSVAVELFESRRQLGGRAGSFVDKQTGETIDHCQHVAMGCCHAFLEYCRTTETETLWERHRDVHFFGPDGIRYDLRATPLLPPPLHLATSFVKLGFLTLRERLAIGRVLLQLTLTRPNESLDRQSIADWLRARGQSEQALARFWSIILVSALSETLDRISAAAARKVFVDGFLSRRDAYQVLTPRVALGAWHEQVANWLRQRGVVVHCGSPVTRCAVDAEQIVLRVGAPAVADANERRFEAAIIAVPWHQFDRLFPKQDSARLSSATLNQFQPAAIASLHLWFDRAVMPLPHAVLIDKTTQWVFRGNVTNGGDLATRSTGELHHLQVVISAAHAESILERQQLVDRIVAELAAIWPAVGEARLVRCRVLLEPQAVFSPRPGLAAARPATRTKSEHLFLAGDWIATGWPATMESAIRSGFQAAEAVRRSFASGGTDSPRT